MDTEGSRIPDWPGPPPVKGPLAVLGVMALALSGCLNNLTDGNSSRGAMSIPTPTAVSPCHFAVYNYTFATPPPNLLFCRWRGAKAGNRG
jgi:hypothetical protein